MTKGRLSVVITFCVVWTVWSGSSGKLGLVYWSKNEIDSNFRYFSLNDVNVGIYKAYNRFRFRLIYNDIEKLNIFMS